MMMMHDRTLDWWLICNLQLLYNPPPPYKTDKQITS